MQSQLVRVRPNKYQRGLFQKAAEANLFVWNWAVEQNNEYFSENGEPIPLAMLSDMFAEFKQTYEGIFLNEECESSLLAVLWEFTKEVETSLPHGLLPHAREPNLTIASFHGSKAKLAEKWVAVPKCGEVAVVLKYNHQVPVKEIRFELDLLRNWWMRVYEQPKTSFRLEVAR